MGENSGIEWCDHTWNPWIGCTRVSEGCRNCYAEGVGKRLGVRWGPHARRRAAPSTLRLPFRWDRRAAREGRRYRVFCASLADAFDPDVPDAWRDEAFAVMALTPHLDWLVLTKRPERMREYFKTRQDRDPWAEAADEIADAIGMDDHPAVLEPKDVPLPNVWLGVSVEDQATADARVPILLDTPAAVRFVSAEPLLGPVDPARAIPGTSRSPLRGGNSDGIVGLTDWPNLPCLDWVIVGGESGPAARPMHPDWVRDLRDQCAAAGVPFHFKQWGEWAPVVLEGDDEGTATAAYPLPGCSDPDRHSAHHDCLFWQGEWVPWPLVAGLPAVGARRVGKKAAGRLLDGRTHDEVPK